MRLDMELEFDKYCVVDGSPTTVLSLPRQHSKTEKRRSKGYSRYPKDVFSLKEEAISRSFNRYRSASCKTSASRKVSVEQDEVRKRGSVYQSSKEVRLMQKTDATQERKKIELSRNSNTPLSFGFVESLCSSDEDDSRGEQRRDSVMSLRSNLSTQTTCKSHVEMNYKDLLDASACPVLRRSVPSDRIKQIRVDSDLEADNQEVKDMNGTCKLVKVLLNDARGQMEKDSTLSFQKSLSAKLTLPHSPACSESDSSKNSSPKDRFGPVRRVIDPFMKTKSHRTPISLSSEQHKEAPSSVTSFSRMKPFCKSLLHDFSNIGQPWQSEESNVKEYRHQSCLNSPAHLQGLLKVEQKHGVPFFEFSVKVPEDLYIAKIWKSDNSLDWTYTLHSAHDRRKSNASGRGSKDSSRLSSLVGQMHASCYLCTEPKDDSVSGNSMVSEFILYNVANSTSVSSQDSSRVYDENSVQGSHNVDEICFQGNVKGQQRRSRHSRSDDSPLSHPLASTELLPHLQAAAVVVQVPLENRESLKSKKGETNNLPGASDVQHSHDNFADFSSPAKVNVVIPSGTHSLPTTESQGPSSLLDRWRVGGGCDCGGWDLACPLSILGNPKIQITEGLLVENSQPRDLFIQGRKDTTPALSIGRTKEGHYAVDFHARLSTLQAFSVSIAVLHATEASFGFSHEQRKCLLQCDSFEAFAKMEVGSLIDAVVDTKKTKVSSKNIKKAMPSFIVNPPFSPIAREEMLHAGDNRADGSTHEAILTMDLQGNTWA